ncbi:bacteriocin, partial [Enterococcus faecalis]|nr:bacteriocin [Enterococcus faecalis]
MKQFKELSAKEMKQVIGGNSSNPGTSNWINGMG